MNVNLDRGLLVVAGALFGLGLAVAGMTDPNKVLAFLDVGGAWNPALAVVMAAALAVHGTAAAIARRRGRPWLAPVFALPTRRDVDLRLLGGAALFGAGWGLAGYCPGPVLASAAGGRAEALLFLAAMSAGWVATAVVEEVYARRPAGSALRE